MVEVVLAGSLLVLIHAFGGKLRFIEYVPRSIWLSGAGGVSVAYVFVHLLPELAEGAEALAEAIEAERFAEHAAWLLALTGLALFYAVEVVARSSRKEHPENITSPGVFWFSIATYAVYNGLIGYLLHEREEAGLSTLILFTVAMSLHFLINDFGLREHHQKRYERFGRWVLVAFIVFGAAVGWASDVPESVRGAILAFIGGGVILNALKEELPREAESRFPAFATGATAYAALLLAV
jgi:hypothetical protein